MTSVKRIRGYALAVDRDRDTAYFLDGSPVLLPEGVIANDNELWRFQFVENPGHRLDTSRCRRVVGDVFCADYRTSLFVREAIQEKLEREAEEVAAGAFRIFGADISRVDGDDVLKLAATRIRDSQTLTFDIVLQSKNKGRQYDGQLAFSRLCKALRISEIDDCDLLVGRIASLKKLPTGSIDFRAAKAA
ncbi:hypothetical protein [Ferirhizobium litorale]|uniref:Uncharacterized protein n=1 Tax=Ferirhizobium litorale TaxID=2927786 RepID=A0AAE3U4U5_9HYPH|nr:hypothetical protein [Fererhizobium litorale]MDI7923384.1 hypothetical protein [Fererhizobium litorale]